MPWRIQEYFNSIIMKTKYMSALFYGQDRSLRGNHVPNPGHSAFKITMIYAIVGALWILFSDTALNRVVQDVDLLSTLQTFKGWFYVLATASMLYALIYRHIDNTLYWSRELMSSYEELEAATEELLAAEEEQKLQLEKLKESEEALRLSEARVFDLSYYDPLTGLPNPTLFHDRVTQALFQAESKKHKAALLYLDLDYFKVINETMGHNTGSDLLIQVGTALKTCLHEIDILTRYSKDEFAIFLPVIHDPESAAEVGSKILKLFENPWLLNQKELYITASIGIAIYPEDSLEGYDLLQKSETAMCYAKGQGRNCFQFYSDKLNIPIMEKFQLENHLRSALRKDEFVLHYQPLADLTTGNIIGVEALLRWQHPDMGLIAPMRFIPLAEASNLILPIGEWVLRTACRQLKEWRDQGFPSMIVSVNLSARQFQQSNLVEMVTAVLNECQVEPSCLEIEITEGIVLHNLELVTDVLHRFKCMGIRIALDDFGTGYSSLNYLKQLPIDTIKIDKSFISGIMEDPREEAIARAIINLAHNLNLSVTAEGVETQEQLLFLRNRFCDKAQGYFLSRPLPADQVEKCFLRSINLVP
ncbi:putative bifunctional diguanylate cyclase/phosphodiesterase [Geosporobacter subterraneus]|nr:EAL domain-containing protein [Geosporobacter subterraneus]